jgi:hypothetical protein
MTRLYFFVPFQASVKKFLKDHWLGDQLISEKNFPHLGTVVLVSTFSWLAVTFQIKKGRYCHDPGGHCPLYSFGLGISFAYKEGF